jgi:LysM repeat protein
MPGTRPAVVAVALAALAFAAPAAAANPQLAGLQVALRAYGLYPGPIDAQAGPATAAAIKAFQRRKHLTVDGIAGAGTRAELGPLGRPLFGKRTIVRGDFGWDVSVLQYLLHRRKLYDGPYDGYAGPETVRALKRYQRQHRLAVDGIAGRATTAVLVRQLHVPVAVKPHLVTRKAPAAAVTKRVYVVRPGENLTVLARRFGIGLGALTRANRLDPAKPLLIGAHLRIPGVAAPPAHVTTRTPAAVTTSSTEIRDALGNWAVRYGVDPRLARALSWMESGYQADVRSSAGAWGPMQLLPMTWDYVVGQLIRRPVPQTAVGNVQVGLAYLQHLLSAFEGDERLALAAWYQGERAVRDHGVYAESKIFVANVLALRDRM